MIIMRR